MEAIQGMAQLRRKLSTLGPRVEKKVIRRAVNRASSLIVKGIQSAAPVGKTRSIKKEIGKKVNAKKPGEITAKIGVGVGKKKKGKSGKTEPHGHLVAAGTAARYTGTRTWKTRGGLKRSRETGNKRAYRGRMTKQPFVKQGTAASQGAAQSIIVNTMKQGIEQEAKKG